MARTKRKPTVGDYFAIVLSPALIMALVGSLVFFLLECLYLQDHQSRLQWILFFFVFGAVLIARISMQTDIAGRAGLYGLVLGGLVWLALVINVDYQNAGPLAGFGWAIDAGLIALIWWCAHRLTWDCTLIDDAVDASGVGLLEVAGLDETAEAPAAAEAESDAAVEAGSKKTGNRADLPGWWARYQRYREEQRRRPHTPGVWVVYFSLAALPLFGLGQALIPTAEVGRRRYAFLLMAVYVTSGLGLLLTTSFLGLRRYLRQRNLTMPATMGGVWLTVGGGLVLALLLGGALLPRPENETPWLEWAGLTAPTRKASPWSFKGDSPGKGPGRRSLEGSKDQAKQEPGNNHEGDPQANDKQGDLADRGKADPHGARSGGKSKGKQPGKEAGKGGAGKGKSQGEGRDRDERDPATGERSEEQRDSAAQERLTGSRRESNSSDNVLTRTLTPVLDRVGPVFKWVLYGLLVLAAAYVLFRAGWAFLKYLANFTLWARNLLAALQAWWASLWGGGTSSSEPAAEAEGDTERVVECPFAAFRNPFLDGTAERRTREELIRYSFEALQAWARERDLGRQPGETPLEFVARLGQETPALEADGRRVASLYVRLAYGRGAVPANGLASLRQFWEQLTEVVEKPLSAGIGSE